MVMAREMYACNKCGKWPITKVVDIDRDKLTQEPRCPDCGGKTHFEKAYEVEEIERPISLFEHCKQESGLTNTVDIKRYINRHYGHN